MNPIETARQHFFEGLNQLEIGDHAAAEVKFAQALELVPDRPSILINLAAVKIRLGKNSEAEPLARRATELDANSPEGWSNLGDVFAAATRHAEALTAYDRALACDAKYFNALQNKAVTLLALGKFEEAVTACDQALRLSPARTDLLLTQSRAFKGLGRMDDARLVYQQFLATKFAASPVFANARSASQKASVLILNPSPDHDDELLPLEGRHFSIGNFPCQLGQRLKNEFHFNFVFAEDVAAARNHSRIPPMDVVINNHANGDVISVNRALPSLAALVDNFRVPVVNHPAKAVQTSRESSARLLADIPGVVMPLTRRFSAVGKLPVELAREIEEQFQYPLITRTLTFQMGIGMNKIDSRPALVEVLSNGCPDEFYVTAFVDSRGKNPFYRKIRAAVVQDEIIIVRADYDRIWKIYARKSDARVAFYRQNPQLLEDEKRLCANPEAVLGRDALEALRRIRQRIPLEIFGIDFDVDGSGRVVIYEANAQMNLLTTARPEVPYPLEPDERLLCACRNFLASLASQAQSAA